MPKGNSLCVKILEEQLTNLSIAPSKPRWSRSQSQFQILNSLCQKDVIKQSAKFFDPTGPLNKYINDKTGELILPNPQN